MTAVLEDLTLGTLQAAIRTEFGGSTGLDAEIKSKINDAIALLWQANKTWRWALRPFSLTSFGSVTTTASLGEAIGSTDIDVTAVGATSSRWVAQPSGDPNEYLVNVVVALKLGLTSPLLKAITAGQSIVVRQGWLELPDDFSYMHTLRTESGMPFGKEPVHVTPYALEKIRKGLFYVQPGAPGFYSIAQDPVPPILNALDNPVYNPNRQYIMFWPYPEANTKWDGFYYGVPRDLSVSGDITVVPRGFRRHIQYKAMSLLAAKLRDFESAQYYEAQASIGFEGLMNANSYADDSDAVYRSRAMSIEQLIKAGMVSVR